MGDVSSVAEEFNRGGDSGYAESSCCLEGRHLSGRGLRRETGSDSYGTRRPTSTDSTGSDIDLNFAWVGVLAYGPFKWWKVVVTYKMKMSYAKHRI